LSLHCKDALYHDGSYDKFLLKENITTTEVSFGQGGKAGPLGGVGLGVSVNEESLERLKKGLNTITFTKPWG
jgi:muconate cycloisomerase